MKMSLQFYFFLVIIAAVAFKVVKADSFLANKPDFLTPCRLTDSNFNKCFAKNFQAIFHQWKDGIPGHKKFGSLDPLHVKRIVIAQDPKNPVALNADLSNVILKGVSTVIVKEARFNSKTLNLNIRLFLPKLRIGCDYKMSGRILNLALNSNGKALFEIENIDMLLNTQLKLRDDYGYTFTDVETLSLDIGNIGGFHVHFDNLFNGHKALEDSTNSIFNENWRDFFEVLHPAISKAVEVIMSDRLSKAYSYVPANYFIEDIPKAAEFNG